MAEMKPAHDASRTAASQPTDTAGPTGGASAATTAVDNPFGQGPWITWLPFLVAATFFMEYLDTTVLATALPQMARSFGVSPNALSLGMSAYMLALAVFLPVSGWLADRFGSKTIFGSAIVIFTLASVLCGASTGVLSFTAARVLQGIGGAMMVPVGRLIVVRAVDRANLMKAIATITWPAIAAPVIGPPLGGVIVTYASWRWIFLLNVPLGIAALIAAGIMIRNTRSDERKPLDLVGFVLSALALTGVMYGTELASQNGADPWIAVAYVLAGIVLGVLSVRHSLGRAHALLDYTTLQVPTFSVTVITGSLTRIGINAVPYLMPLLFQVGFGLSAFHSGLLLLVSAAGNLGMKALTTPLLKRYGFRVTSLVDVFVGGASIIGCGLLSPGTPVAITLVVIFVYGCARSMQYSLLATLAYADIPKPRMTNANTLWNAALQMSIGLGIAFGALCLRVASAWREHDLALHAGNDGATATAAMAADAATNPGMPSSHLVLADFRWAFMAAGVLTLLSLWGYWRLSPQAGRHLSKA